MTAKVKITHAAEKQFLTKTTGREISLDKRYFSMYSEDSLDMQGEIINES